MLIISLPLFGLCACGGKEIPSNSYEQITAKEAK